MGVALNLLLPKDSRFTLLLFFRKLTEKMLVTSLGRAECLAENTTLSLFSLKRNVNGFLPNFERKNKRRVLKQI